MTTILLRRGTHCLVGELILTALEPLGESHQVVYFVRDKAGNKYRVPRSEVVLKSESKPKGKKRRKVA